MIVGKRYKCILSKNRKIEILTRLENHINLSDCNEVRVCALEMLYCVYKGSYVIFFFLFQYTLTLFFIFKRRKHRIRQNFRLPVSADLHVVGVREYRRKCFYNMPVCESLLIFV